MGVILGNYNEKEEKLSISRKRFNWNEGRVKRDWEKIENEKMNKEGRMRRLILDKEGRMRKWIMKKVWEDE